MSNKEGSWFRLDNAGKLYPSIASTRVSTLFRLSATLNELVEPDILQKALDNIIDRFPYFKVNIKKGAFWYYLYKATINPKIEPELFYPCMNLNVKKKYSFPFRVLYYKKKISIEISHSITDGNGALIFLKTLIFEYFKLKGIKLNKADLIFDINEPAKKCEFEDSFNKNYKASYPNPEKKVKALQFPFELDSKGIYHILTGIIPVDSIIKLSKQYNATITEFICALYFQSILDFVIQSNDKSLLKPIVLNIPVNLRPIYNSKTMRNFFISITPHIDPRLGYYSLEELISYIKSYINITVNKKYMDMQIKSTVKNERSPFVRILPIVLKDFFLPIFYKKRGESRYTSSISNLGKIKLPKVLEDKIERFEFYPPPSKGNLIKIGLISYKDYIYISFGKLTIETEIEKIFFKKLRKMGINIKIETNQRW